MGLPDRIGRYRVQSVVGAGGFAIVVRAHDDALDDSVAIKILAENWATDPDIRRRFVEEARLLRRVRSDHIVTVHDIGELEDERPYFVMSFAERGSFADRLEGRQGAGLDPASADSIVTTLAGGLTALHAAGIVHRDVNPRNLLIRPRAAATDFDQRRAAATQVRTGLIGTDEQLLLGDLGLAKDYLRGDRAGMASVLGGTPFYLAPEQARPDGVIGPPADVYAATGVLWEAITGSSPPVPERLADEVQSIDGRWRPFFTKGLAAEPGRRFPDMGAWHSAVLDLIGDDTEVTGVRVARAPGVATSPYKGLAAFQPEDATRFFGRDALVATLVDRLSQDRVLVVGGPSGSGKSSLVRAGLIPAVGAGAIPGSERWPVALFTPRTSPNAELSYQLLRVMRGVTQRSDDMDAGAVGDDMGIRLVTDTITDASGGLVMVIDQFEELFTLNSRAEQEAFIDLLAAVSDPTGSRVRVVLAIRADFYAAAASFPWLADRITANQVLVGPMRRPELRQAIEQPATVAGLRLEEGLVDAVLEDGGGEPGALPLVSHAMAETWRRRDGSTLTLAGYREAGGVGGAIAHTAEDLYGDGFDPSEEAACRRLMLGLVTPGEGTSDARRRLPLGDLDQDPEPGVIRRVVDAMADARLLTVDRESIEVAHEALLHTWPRLRDWIEESRDDLRTRQHIRRAADEWVAHERDPDLLYRGTPLQVALEWREEHGELLGSEEREFLAAGEAARRAAREESERVARRTRWIRRVAIAVLAVATGAAIVAYLFAQSESRRAESRFGQALATQAVGLAGEDPRTALALAVEAMVRGSSESLDARSALVDGSGALESMAYAPWGPAVPVGDALSITARPDGRLIVTGNRDGSIELWSGTGERIGASVPGHGGAVEEMVFTPDGLTLVSAGHDGILMAWDLADPMMVPPPTQIGDNGSTIWGIAISPDGSTIASTGEDGTVRLWNLDGTVSPTVLVDRDDIAYQAVAFSPGGDLILAGDNRGQITGWSLPDGTESVAPFTAHSDNIQEVIFDPEGAAYASAAEDGIVRLWDIDTHAELREPFRGAAEYVAGVQITPRGEVVAGDENGQLWVSPIAGLAQQPAGVEGDARITDAAWASGMLVTLGHDQQIQVWTRPERSAAIVLPGHTGGAFGLATDRAGSRLATGDGIGNVRVFSVDDGELLLGPLPLHQDAVWGLAFSDDGTKLASGARDGSIRVIDPESGAALEAPSISGSWVKSLLFVDDLLVSGSDDGVVRVWDGAALHRDLGPHRGGVTSMALGPGGEIAAAAGDGTVHFWEVDAGTSSRTPLEADDNTVWGVDWYPDGSLLATALDDQVVKIWDPDSGELQNSLSPNPDGAKSTAFLGDGRSLVSTSGDGSVRVWDVKQARPLGEALGGPGNPGGGHVEPAWRVVAVPGGSRFATSSEDGTVRIWDVLDLERACERIAQSFIAESQRRFLGEGETPAGCREES